MGEVSKRRIMRRQEKMILDLIDSMPGMVVFKDYEGHWLKANRTLLDNLGLSNADYVGKNGYELADLSNNPFAMLRWVESDAIAWHKGRTITLEENLGDTYWEVKKQPIYTPANSKLGIIVTCREITHEKILEQTILQSFKEEFN